MRRGLVAAALVVLTTTCGGPTSLIATPQPSTQQPSPSAVFVATPLPSPRTTPPGTPGPIPSTPTTESAKIATPSPFPSATATPSAEPGLWRVGGFVVDESGAPLPSVCVVVGPNGCRPFSPHTDDRGYWSLDVAAGQATFDFYFEMPGHQTVWWHTTPTGPTEFDVILAKG